MRTQRPTYIHTPNQQRQQPTCLTSNVNNLTSNGKQPSGQRRDYRPSPRLVERRTTSSPVLSSIVGDRTTRSPCGSDEGGRRLPPALADQGFAPEQKSLGWVGIGWGPKPNILGWVDDGYFC